MAHISVSNLEYAHPGGDTLFAEVSFTVAPGSHAALIGNNGVGKTTLMRVLAGELGAADGDASIGGEVRYMAQDVGVSASDVGQTTVRDMLIECMPEPGRTIGRDLADAERSVTAAGEGDVDTSMALAEAIGAWSDCGGYQAEADWDATLQRVVRSGLDEVGARLASQLSGGERKQIVLDLLFNSNADVLLLDEPDNYLDVPAKHWLEKRITATDKTVLLISHDRELLANATNRVVTLEAFGAWVHGESYASYNEARDARQQRLGDALERWNDEERRLYRFYKIMKERAKLNDGNAPRANAAETRWKKFVAAGPPPPPALDQKVKMRLKGGDSGRRVVSLASLELPDLLFAFSGEIFFGERIGLIGPNGSGKTHLLRLLAGEPHSVGVEHHGVLKLGARVEPGLFTQINNNPAFDGRTTIEPVLERQGNHERAMRSLARYGLAGHERQPYETLSGGQKARLEILCLELDGHNLLLLDEPTDNLDIDSAIALEGALESFEGTVIAVSHDRAFLTTFDRFWMLDHDGKAWSLPDWETGRQALTRADQVSKIKFAKQLTEDL